MKDQGSIKLQANGILNRAVARGVVAGERARGGEMNQVRGEGFYWHVHHDGLASWCWGYEERVRAIEQKPANEIETRLRLFQPVKGKLPQELLETGAAYVEARAAYNKAWAAYDEARAAYVEALLVKHKPALKALHALECPGCPWNGEQLQFPKEVQP